MSDDKKQVQVSFTKILQIIDRVDEEKWEKLKEEEHERLLNSQGMVKLGDLGQFERRLGAWEKDVPDEGGGQEGVDFRKQSKRQND